MTQASQRYVNDHRATLRKFFTAPETSCENTGKEQFGTVYKRQKFLRHKIALKIFPKYIVQNELESLYNLMTGFEGDFDVSKKS